MSESVAHPNTRTSIEVASIVRRDPRSVLLTLEAERRVIQESTRGGVQVEQLLEEALKNPENLAK